MWPTHHSQPLFTSNPNSSLWGDGSGNQDFTNYPVNTPYQYPQTLPPTIANLTPTFSEGTAGPGEPTIPSASVDQRVQPLLQQNLETNKPQCPESNSQANKVRNRKRVSQNPRHSSSDWERQRLRIKELYIVRDLSLDKTREIMSESWNFNAPIKKYKEKLKEWRFVKYVPKEVVQWMFHKSEQRSRPDSDHPEGRATHFEYGVTFLTTDDVKKRFQRANLDMGEGFDLDAPTPKDVLYKTPHDVALSPPTTQGPGQSRGTGVRWTPVPSPHRPQHYCLPPTFNNHTLADYEAMEHQAQQHESEGETDMAEEMYREALAGFENILSPTHEHTKRLAYQLACFYANCNRMDDADEVLNWIIEKHVGRWGVNHENTMEQFLHISRLYNGWSRNDESLSILYRVLDTWDEQAWGNGNSGSPTRLGAPGTMEPPKAVPRRNAQSLGSTQTSRAWEDTDDPLRVDYELGLVNTRLASGDATAENTLLLLIEQCEIHQQKLSLQMLRARCTLVNLYRRQGHDAKGTLALEKAREAVDRILTTNIEKSEVLLKTCTDVGKLYLQEQGDEPAEDIFQNISAEAEDVFQEDRAPAITMFIHIGKIYQNENSWSKAEPWFERALAASMAAGELDSPLTKALEAALEDRHYSSTCLTSNGKMTFTLDELRRIKFIG